MLYNLFIKYIISVYNNVLKFQKQNHAHLKIFDSKVKIIQVECSVLGIIGKRCVTYATTKRVS